MQRSSEEVEADSLIKSEYTIVSRPMEVAAQIALYAKLLKPGGALLGLPGSMSEKVKGVTLRCSYRRQAPGLIAYDLDFDVGDLIKKLVNAV